MSLLHGTLQLLKSAPFSQNTDVISNILPFQTHPVLAAGVKCDIVRNKIHEQVNELVTVQESRTICSKIITDSML